jgi:uncharacterized Zn-finger protein
MSHLAQPVARVQYFDAGTRLCYRPHMRKRLSRDNLQAKGPAMADMGIPHFHNDLGVERIEIGAREFKCTGAREPYDHPHVYLDMGDDSEIICPYCSTLFVHNPALGGAEANPAACAYAPGEAA